VRLAALFSPAQEVSMRHVLLVALTAATFVGADATGTWTGTFTPSATGQPVPAHLVLKQEGDKLTGTIGPDADQQRPIRNGKAENERLTFEAGNDEEGVMKFDLKQNGDEITGDLTREREGKTQTAKLAVKRAK
jgi:hypothetical protein